MKPKTLLTVAAILLFVAFLAYSTLSAQKVTCNVCVEFNGRTNCAPASAKDELEATRAAQNTACGPVTSGMNETIACGNRPAVSQTCRKK
jgi:hypothetical protein